MYSTKSNSITFRLSARTPLLRKHFKRPFCQLFVVAVLVELLYITMGVLWNTRYMYPYKCSNETDTSPVEGDDSPELLRDDEYYFTVGLYTIGSLMRCIEFIPLFIGLYQFYKSKNSISRKLEHPCHCIWVLLIPLLPLILLIPSVGIAVEYANEKTRHCNDVTAIVFVAYCAVNYFRYAWAFLVRAGIILATLKVRELWGRVPSVGSGYDGTAAALHARLTNGYMETGKNVKRIAHIFQSWFLFPWIIFFISSSVEGKDILSIWDEKRENVETLPMVYFVLYNVNQMIYLLIPYICGRKMNHYHHQCHVRIKEMQLSPSLNDDFRAQQRTMLIQYEYDYDFVPHFWGLGFKVEMSSMIYVIFLILGLLFTLFGAML